MHGGTRLGHDDRHSLVHKNHFEQDTEGLSGMAENDAGLDWLVQGSFGLSRESMGALPGQRIRKENCESCVELEQMLAKGKSKTMREGAYKRYMKLGSEALKKHRESQNLDLVVANKMQKLAALQVGMNIFPPLPVFRHVFWFLTSSHAISDQSPFRPALLWAIWQHDWLRFRL